MRLETLPQRTRRLIAVGLLAAVALLALLAIIAPTIGLITSSRERIAEDQAELARRKLLSTEAPALQELIARVDAHPIWQRLYGGDSAPADLQRDFRGLAESQGLSLESLQPLEPANVDGDFTGLRLRISLNTSIDHLGKLLLAMDAAPKLLRFDNLSITAPMAQNHDGNPTLVVRGDVVAYTLAGDPQ